jgi:hypothetical protein
MPILIDVLHRRLGESCNATEQCTTENHIDQHTFLRRVVVLLGSQNLKAFTSFAQSCLEKASK